jgi:hypothetical protein
VAVASFDDVLGAVEMNAPDAATVLVSWSRSHQSCAVMGLLDDDGNPLDVPADLLARLTGLLARPVGVDALRWAFPDADTSGSVILRIGVHEPVSGLFAQNVLEHVVNGLPAADGDIRDALWLLLDALALPAGSVRVHRLVLTPELPGDAVFEPVALAEHSDGSGEQVPWQSALHRLPGSVTASAIAALSSELAERAEKASALRGRATVLTDAVVSL